MENTNKEPQMLLLQQIRRNELQGRQLYRAVHEFGKTGFIKARKDIEDLLMSEDPEIRYISLEVLTRHWQIVEHWETARRFLEEDGDTDCRIMGASALETLKRGQRDYTTLNVLAHVVANSQEKHIVREAAYAAMLGVLHPDPQEQARMAIRGIDLEHDVDWNLIKSHL